jgi:hypothetical protein
MASDRPLDWSRSRLVIVVLRETSKVDVGMGWPAGVGVPPEQFSNMSPTSSVIPSARARKGLPALAWHETGGIGIVATVPITLIEKLTAPETAENLGVPTGNALRF